MAALPTMLWSLGPARVTWAHLLEAAGIRKWALCFETVMDGFLPARKWLGILLSQELPRNSFNIGRLQMKLQKTESTWRTVHEYHLKDIRLFGGKSKLPDVVINNQSPKWPVLTLTPSPTSAVTPRVTRLSCFCFLICKMGRLLPRDSPKCYKE